MLRRWKAEVSCIMKSKIRDVQNISHLLSRCIVRLGNTSHLFVIMLFPCLFFKILIPITFLILLIYSIKPIVLLIGYKLNVTVELIPCLITKINKLSLNVFPLSVGNKASSVFILDHMPTLYIGRQVYLFHVSGIKFIIIY